MVKQYYEAASQGVKQLPERKLPKKTDGYEQIIEEKLKTGAPAIAIYHYLRDEKGFTGSYSTIKQYIHNYHRLQQHQAVIRFETTPGLQAQVDWKESLKFRTKNGDEIKFNVYANSQEEADRATEAIKAFISAKAAQGTGSGSAG